VFIYLKVAVGARNGKKQPLNNIKLLSKYYIGKALPGR